jgi:hypothetical protein
MLEIKDLVRRFSHIKLPSDGFFYENVCAILFFLRTGMNPIYSFPLIDPVTGKRFVHDFDLRTLKTKEVFEQPNDDKTFNFIFKKSFEKNGEYVEVPAKFRLLTGADEKRLRKYEDERSSENYMFEKLCLLVTEIGGNEDKKFIRKFLQMADMEETFALNKKITDVTPGLDLNLNIQSPGGGLVETYFPFSLNFLLPGVLGN